MKTLLLISSLLFLVSCNSGGGSGKSAGAVSLQLLDPSDSVVSNIVLDQDINNSLAIYEVVRVYKLKNISNRTGEFEGVFSNSPNFEVTNDCDVLAPGETCNIEIRFIQLAGEIGIITGELQYSIFDGGSNKVIMTGNIDN